MSIEEIIQDYIVSDLLPSHQADLNTDQSLLTVLDSLDLESLILFLEERFGFSVEHIDVTLENFRSIQSIAAYVERRVSSQDNIRR